MCVCGYTYRNNHDVVLQEDLVSIRGGWAVGSLSDDLIQTRTKTTKRQPLHSCKGADRATLNKATSTGPRTARQMFA